MEEKGLTPAKGPHVPSTYHPEDANPRADGSHCGDDVKFPSLVMAPGREGLTVRRGLAGKAFLRSPNARLGKEASHCTVSWPHSLLPRLCRYMLTDLQSGALGFELGSASSDTGRKWGRCGRRLEALSSMVPRPIRD